ncbi:MAG: hypothetical protein RJA70_1111 [Pseudomonadota bacterium]|jgi:DNA-binding beta-propeller fold protein YncE
MKNINSLTEAGVATVATTVLASRWWLLLTALCIGACGTEDDPNTEEPEAPCVPGPGVICSVAGTGVAGLTADSLPPAETELYLPQDVTQGPDQRLYIVDWNNHRVRVIDDGKVETLVGTGYLGDAPNGAGREVNLNHPTHISFDLDGNMIISAWHNSKVMRYDMDTEQVEGICGTGMRSFNMDGLSGKETVLDLPVATAIGKDGSIYISDQANQRIRRLTPDDLVETVAGTGMPGYSGDGGPALEAQIHSPIGQSAQPGARIALGADGALYLADTSNHVVRKIDTDGIITTIAGTGKPGNGSGKVATEARLDTPSDVAVDKNGNVYIADTENSCIRKVTPKGALSTVAGKCGEGGFAGDGGQADEALLDRPYGLDIAANGALYIADTHNHRVRVVHAR